MACKTCAQKRNRFAQLSAMQQKARQRKGAIRVPVQIPKSVNTNRNVTSPTVTAQGWVVRCTICGVAGEPQAFPNYATTKCNCSKGT